MRGRSVGEGLPVEGKIAPADAVERIVIEHFGACRLCQLVVVGHIEHLVQTFAKVVRVFGPSVSIFQIAALPWKNSQRSMEISC